MTGSLGSLVHRVCPCTVAETHSLMAGRVGSIPTLLLSNHHFTLGNLDFLTPKWSNKACPHSIIHHPSKAHCGLDSTLHYD